MPCARFIGSKMTSQRPRKRKQPQSGSNAPERQTPRFTFLESGTLRAGAVAAALVAVLTLVFFATDRLSFLHHHPPAQMQASISDLMVSPPLTLAEFDERTRASPASLTTPLSPSGQSGRGGAEFVSDETGSTVASSQSATVTTTGPTVSTASTSGTTTTPPSTITTSTSSSNTSTTSTTSTSCAPATPAGTGTTATATTSCTATTGSTPGGPAVLSVASMFAGPASHLAADAATVGKLRGFLAGGGLSHGFSGFQGPVHTEVKIMCGNGIFAGVSEGCPSDMTSAAPGSRTGGGSNPGSGSSSGGGARVSQGEAHAILAVFGRTRMRARQPVGVSVSYAVTLSGFVGHRVDVRWTLWSVPHGAGSTTELPEQWLQNRRVETLVGQAVNDAANPQFWIPIPVDPGPFQVEVAAYDSSGVRLSHQLSRPFG